MAASMPMPTASASASAGGKTATTTARPKPRASASATVPGWWAWTLAVVAVALAFAWDRPPSTNAGSWSWLTEARIHATNVVRALTGAPPLRIYRQSDTRVFNHYKQMRMHQTSAFYDRMVRKFTYGAKQMTIREAFDLLGKYVDASDPDVSLPNAVHAFQSAEAARAAGEPDWMQLTVLLHDFGKLTFALGGTPEDGMSGKADGPQWALGGDTWVLGEPIPDTVVFPELNPLNPEYNVTSALPDGIGLDRLNFTYGHDEYGFRWLSFPANGCKLPREALQAVRLHSAYPLHTGGSYTRLLKPEDEATLAVVRRFNRYDLYSKSDTIPTLEDVEKLWPYYNALIDKYFERGHKGKLFF